MVHNNDTLYNKMVSNMRVTQNIDNALSMVHNTHYTIKNITLRDNSSYPPVKKRTSVRLTQSHWHLLKDICLRENIQQQQLLSYIGEKIQWNVCLKNRYNRKERENLSNAIRVFILSYYYALSLQSYHHRISQKLAPRADSPLT